MREDYGEAVIEPVQTWKISRSASPSAQQNRLEPLEALVEERLAAPGSSASADRSRSTGPLGDVLPPRADDHERDPRVSPSRWS